MAIATKQTSFSFFSLQSLSTIVILLTITTTTALAFSDTTNVKFQALSTKGSSNELPRVSVGLLVPHTNFRVRQYGLAVVNAMMSLKKQVAYYYRQTIESINQ